MDDLGLVLVELTQQINGSRTGDQDQLHRIAERAEANLFVDLPELPGQIERSCSSWVGGEEQDLDHVGPYLVSWILEDSSAACPKIHSIGQIGRPLCRKYK